VRRQDVALPAVALLAALVGVPRAAVFALAAAGVVISAAALVRALGPPAEDSLLAAARERAPEDRRPPRRLLEAQRLVVARGGSAGGVHYWLRPLLRDVVGERVLRHHGVDLDDPAAAAVVPEPLWELVRPDRPAPPDRNAPGPPFEALDRAVEQAAAL
jgi:hypothetical protein